MIVVIIVIFVLSLLAVFVLSKETFTNPGMIFNKNNDKEFTDTVVPQNLGYSDITSYYNERMEDGLKGTSLVNVSAIDSGRFPIMLETPTNWYNTQGLIIKDIKLGSDNGKLPESDCHCESGRF